MSTAGEAKRLREQGEAEARSARLRARAASDTRNRARSERCREDARRARRGTIAEGRRGDARLAGGCMEAAA
jgi:hypothetical protein